MPTQGDPAEELFGAALPLSPEERLLFLDRTCEGAPDLRRAVEKLLAAGDELGSFLEEPPLPAPQSPMRGEATASSSARNSGLDANGVFEIDRVIFNRFKILRFIARGGMGEVWEAWDSQLQERVAVKTIRADMARHPEALERFRREVRQARAISHPNICRIHELFTYETASHAKGIFLSMEFLDGPTLSEYLRRGDLALLSPSVRFVGIIDGEFFQKLAVSPKEIIEALARGITVFGSSSMGALRAAETHTFGMVGIGRVFEQFRDGVLDADDEVALAYEAGTYRALSDAMVNLREALALAHGAGFITESQHHALCSEMKSRYFPYRSWRALEQICPALIKYAEGQPLPDLKRDDACALLTALAVARQTNVLNSQRCREMYTE